MNKINSIGLIFLVFIIMSYALTAETYAQIPETSMPPLFVKTELSLYSSGSTVNISGIVKSLNENFEQPVIIRILDDNGNIVSIGQTMPAADGSFSFNTKAGGTWKTPGEYHVLVNYGAQKANNTFEFITEVPTPSPPPPPPPKCDPNQILVNDKCVDEKLECDPNQILVNGICIDNEPYEQTIVCGPGSTLVDGKCVVIRDPNESGGCLIATASFGSELAPQVQMLREIRDNVVLTTYSGTLFMNGFNAIYYSFSPAIADLERQNPIFKEAVKAFITPMISTLSILTLAEEGSESQVLGLGISVIALNLGMYVAAPTVLIYQINKVKK